MTTWTNLTAKTGIFESQVLSEKYSVGVDPSSFRVTPEVVGTIEIGTDLYEAVIAQGRFVGRDIGEQLGQNLEALTGRSYSERQVRTLVASHVLAECTMVGDVRTMGKREVHGTAKQIVYKIKPANVAESRYKKPAEYEASFRMIGPHEAGDD